jgi:hypothetical protein
MDREGVQAVVRVGRRHEAAVGLQPVQPIAGVPEDRLGPTDVGMVEAREVGLVVDRRVPAGERLRSVR